VDSPTEIARHVKKEYGLKLTPKHVSTIKGNLKKAGKKPGRKPGRKPAAAAQATSQPTKPSSSRGGGLTTQDLAALIELAGRAGGFDVLQQYVEVLKR
jgi:hypothetical protein